MGKPAHITAELFCDDTREKRCAYRFPAELGRLSLTVVGDGNHRGNQPGSHYGNQSVPPRKRLSRPEGNFSSKGLPGLCFGSVDAELLGH
jgi:hypothetical protein